MVDVLQMNASQVANVAILCSIPWCLKPLIAAASDKTTCCCGYRRRPYVSVFSLICGIVMLITPQFATREEDKNIFVLCLALTSLCVCVVDVCLDGSLMVLVAKEKGSSSEGVAQGHAWAARVAGTTIGAGWGGKVFTFSFTTLMVLSAILPLIMTIVAFDIPDAPPDKEGKRSLKQRVHEYTSASRCHVVRTTAFTLWQCRLVLGAAVALAPVLAALPAACPTFSCQCCAGLFVAVLQELLVATAALAAKRGRWRWQRPDARSAVGAPGHYELRVRADCDGPKCVLATPIQRINQRPPPRNLGPA